MPLCTPRKKPYSFRSLLILNLSPYIPRPHPLHARRECRSSGLKHHTPKLVLSAFHTWRPASTRCQGQQHQTHTHTHTYMYIYIYIHTHTHMYIYIYNMVAYYMCFLKIQTLIIINYVGIYKAARLVLGQLYGPTKDPAFSPTHPH